MLAFRFKLIVLRMLYAILEIHVSRMVVDPENTPHSWSGLMTDAKELINDYEAQIEDLNRPQYIPEEEDSCGTI